MGLGRDTLCGNIPPGPPSKGGIGEGVPKGGIRKGEIDAAFNKAVYSSRVEQASLSARFHQVSAKKASGGDEETNLAAQQLTFSFFGEVRAAELTQFMQRTDQTADGLDASRQEQYLTMRQELAARFELSFSINGASLDGFAKASEQFADAAQAAFDQFIGFAGDRFKESDEIVQQILEMFNGFSQGGGSDAAVQSFMDGIYKGLSGQTGSAEVTQAVSASYQFEFSFVFKGELQVEQAQVQESDPIVLDLDDDGIELTHYTDGARFDISGSGAAVKTAFVTGGDAFLAIDRDGNGQIDSGRELFGDQLGAANGFEQLRSFDTNGDSVVNRSDANFDALMLFRDNGDGKTEKGELISLKDAGITEISLGYRNVNQQAMGGNRITQIASYQRQDGTRGLAADAVLNFAV
ncbi:MAG: hypothetical protein QG656_572 [Candidatus Hydrogenedentes bacterium]|nr:hypothetical protein [Candidatus Hydrogenedentota bacterium]